MLDLARACMAQGWDIFPVRDKRPLIKWKEGACRTWESWPDDADIGIATGARSGIVVVDDDRSKHGLEPWQSPCPTARVETRSGGWHYYFRHPGGRVPNSAGKLAPYVDVRGDGGYVVAYGVLHDEVACLPDGLITSFSGKPKTAVWVDPAALERVSHMLLRMPPWPEGGRNITLFKMACTFLENKMDVTVLYQKALQSGVLPEDAERTLASARARVVN